MVRFRRKRKHFVSNIFFIFTLHCYLRRNVETDIELKSFNPTNYTIIIIGIILYARFGEYQYRVLRFSEIDRVPFALGLLGSTQNLYIYSFSAQLCTGIL